MPRACAKTPQSWSRSARRSFWPGLDQALQQASRTVPIVMAQGLDPVGNGYVDSLARPGGNITGFIQFEYALAGKWAELLKERSEEHTSELQSLRHLVCRLLLEKKKKKPVK